jgi:hypothetical protein
MVRKTRPDLQMCSGRRAHASAFALCIVTMMCAAPAVSAQGLSHYRDFALGSGIQSVADTAGIAITDVKTIHQRPALLQELEWRLPHWITGSAAASTDPVEHVLFSFYDDQLFQVVVDYGHARTEGMTGADMTEAISEVYGAPLPRTARTGRVPSRLESESGAVVARWGNAANAAALYQTTSYGAAFRLIVSDLRLAELARKAEVQAQRLDEQEAPRREVARQDQERADGRVAAAKARVANKAVFRP